MTWERDGSGLFVKRIRGKTMPRLVRIGDLFYEHAPTTNMVLIREMKRAKDSLLVSHVEWFKKPKRMRRLLMRS